MVRSTPHGLNALRPGTAEHGPLHSVAALSKALPGVRRLLLPESLSAPRGPWAYAAIVAPTALFLGWKTLQIPGLDEGLLSWVVAVAIGALAAVAVWGLVRHERRLRGWYLDFDQCSAVAVGQGDVAPIALNAAEYSMGCYLSSGPGHGLRYVVELRHVRRGPVAQLTSVTFSANRRATFDQELHQLDRCVDMLAERLHIRRSGEPLRKPSASAAR